MKRYLEFHASGTNRELGRAHGEQAAAHIRGYLDFLSGQLQLSRDAMRSRALKFLPLFERDCPHLIEEIHGLAEGADIEFADALAAQLRGELGQVTDGACTTFVISARGTANGETLIGQDQR